MTLFRANARRFSPLLAAVGLSLMALLPTDACANPPPPPKTPVDRLYEQSHMEDFLIAAESRRGLLVSLATHLPVPPDVAQMEALMSNVLMLEPMSARARELLAKSYNPVPASKAIAFAKDPVHHKLLGLEAEASLPIYQQNVRDYLESLDKAPLSKERLALLAKLDEQTRSSEWMTAILLQLSESLKTQAAEQEDFKYIKRKDLDSMIENLKNEAQNYEKSRPGMQFLAYAYRDVKDATLQKFSNDLASDDAQWMINLSKTIVMQSMTPSIDLYAQRFIDKL
ncbi:hypothetical protein ACKC9G_06250 [Pokkaliibacter sp. CJK22405]|uniref:hypothetical protein n=1 Tax=Pokkaliibacter sp. CJK22405 TaxID=3384615 RepID=UPI00398493DF